MNETVTINNRSYARIAALTTEAANADYKGFANANLSQFFITMLEMDDSQIVELIDLYNATADINRVAKRAING